MSKYAAQKHRKLRHNSLPRSRKGRKAHSSIAAHWTKYRNSATSRLAAAVTRRISSGQTIAARVIAPWTSSTSWWANAHAILVMHFDHAEGDLEYGMVMQVILKANGGRR